MENSILTSSSSGEIRKGWKKKTAKASSTPKERCSRKRAEGNVEEGGKIAKLFGLRRQLGKKENQDSLKHHFKILKNIPGVVLEKNLRAASQKH